MTMLASTDGIDRRAVKIEARSPVDGAEVPFALLGFSAPDQDANERPGTLNDLTEDCLLAATKCGVQPDSMGGYAGN